MDIQETPAVFTPRSLGADPAKVIESIDVHLITPEEVYTRYSTHLVHGLDSATAQDRLKDGKNSISPPPTQYWKKALNYIFGGFNFLMWIAFIVSLVSSRLVTASQMNFTLGVATLLLLVITLAATFYALVDWNASRILKSVRSLIAKKASVIRDGKKAVIPATDLVVGDIVVLGPGDLVPADLRIVKASPDLLFDRSLLTGESNMMLGVLIATSNNALETHNLALKSTILTQGTCTGVTFATGDRTIMGRLVAMSGDKKLKLTTIQKELWFFTKIISCLALFFFLFSLFLYGIWLRNDYPGYDATIDAAIVNSLGCLTAFVPQGLPIAFALSLTAIARRMAKRSVLVKNLATIETLGCTTVLCSDKTGTFTAGKMMLEDIAFLDNNISVLQIQEKVSKSSSPATFAGLKAVHQITRMCNAAKFDTSTAEKPIKDRAVKGDQTDAALLRFSEAFSVPSLDIDTTKLLGSWTKHFDIPFNSRNKWALTVVVPNDKQQEHSAWMLVKGAPDVLLPWCSRALQCDGISIPFGLNERQRMSALQNEWASRGQHVLALCRKSLDRPPNAREELMYSEMQDLTFVSLVSLHDPPREDVPSAIETIKRAGVRIFMVTGDFKLTAVAIARQIRLITQERVDTIENVKDIASSYKKGFKMEVKSSEDDPIRSLVLTGEEISILSPPDWDVVVGRYNEIVFARTTPDQKVMIVEEIKLRGDNIVAVIGDGVNDAPALKVSDIGVAMGSGSDAAKEAASLVLLKNDFASIPFAIEMGRLAFENLRKVTLYLMPAGSYAEFMGVVSNVLLGMQLPISAYQQVSFSIANDLCMSISLMYEKAEFDLMTRKPRNARSDRLTDWRLFVQIYLFIGLMIWPCAMAMWFLYMQQQHLYFHDVIFVFNKWTDGWQGYPIVDLKEFVYVGNCIYYVTLTIIQWGTLLAVRNRRLSMVTSNPFWGPHRNLVVLFSLIGTTVIALVNIYGPELQKVFDTRRIPAEFWGIPFGFAVGILLMDELRKLIVRMYPKSFIAWIAW